MSCYGEHISLLFPLPPGASALHTSYCNHRIRLQHLVLPQELQSKRVPCTSLSWLVLDLVSNHPRLCPLGINLPLLGSSPAPSCGRSGIGMHPGCVDRGQRQLKSSRCTRSGTRACTSSCESEQALLSPFRISRSGNLRRPSLQQISRSS